MNFYYFNILRLKCFSVFIEKRRVSPTAFYFSTQNWHRLASSWCTDNRYESDCECASVCVFISVEYFSSSSFFSSWNSHAIYTHILAHDQNSNKIYPDCWRTRNRMWSKREERRKIWLRLNIHLCDLCDLYEFISWNYLLNI